MNTLPVSDFLEKNPEVAPYVFHTEGTHSKWGRVLCVWKEKNAKFSHLYLPLINLENGDIYLDCFKKKIYAKLVTHLFYRPILLAIKTIYHALFPLSLAHIIYKTVQEGKVKKKTNREIAKNCLRNSVRSLADIVRTPLYGLAMMVVNIAALLIGPFAPRTIYTSRELLGRLIKKLQRHDENSNLPLNDQFICFTPLRQLQTISQRHFKYDNTDYGSNNNTLIGLTNFAANQIQFRRANYGFFNNPFGKLDPKIRYISSSYGDIAKMDGVPNYKELFDETLLVAEALV